MNTDEPIVVPDECWTKDRIYEQLEDENGAMPTFIAAEIPDEVAADWVREESNIAFNAISHGEEYYGDEIADVNKVLIKRTEMSLT